MPTLTKDQLKTITLCTKAQLLQFTEEEKNLARDTMLAELRPFVDASQSNLVQIVDEEGIFMIEALNAIHDEEPSFDIVVKMYRGYLSIQEKMKNRPALEEGIKSFLKDDASRIYDVARQLQDFSVQEIYEMINNPEAPMENIVRIYQAVSDLRSGMAPLTERLARAAEQAEQEEALATQKKM